MKKSSFTHSEGYDDGCCNKHLKVNVVNEQGQTADLIENNQKLLEKLQAIRDRLILNGTLLENILDASGPSNTVAPEIAGITQRGEVLSCTTGTWTGVGTITYAYQWRRNGANITGATNSTYTLVAADDDTDIDCVVTATDNEGSSSKSSNVVGPILGDPLNLTLPSITGTATVRETLTVSNGTWQGVATITFAYQWRKDGVNISGATNSTYTLLDADYDSNIDCIVTATNSLGSTPATAPQTAAIAGLAPTVDTAPVISGSTSLGSTLTRTSQGVYDAVPAATVTGGQWRRNGTPIPGETGTTYDITLADSGADIDYLETAQNALGQVQSDSNNITAQTFTAPVNTVAPSISGDDPATIDDVLTRVEGTWSGNPTPTLAGEWYRNNVATGETGSTYTVTSADDNSFIFYRETATNAIGSASEDSAAVTIEDFTVPAITGSPTIAGTEEVGETLTATAASVTGNPTPTRTWQWQRSADGSTGWADIAGATASTYLLDAADEGNFVRVKQIETNALGSDEAVSAASGEIQGGGAAGLLDSYKGSAFAMSPDTLLYSTYSATDDISGSVTNGDPGQFSVAILRDSDNAVRSFTPAEVADGTANTWVQAGVGGAANGFVRRAYDQSVTAQDVSNLNHADQSDPTKMPKLFDSSTGLILENGKAALQTLGISRSNLKFTSDISTSSSDYSMFFIVSHDLNGTQRIFDNRVGIFSGNVNRFVIHAYGGGGAYNLDSSTYGTQFGGLAQNLKTYLFVAPVSNLYLNGSFNQSDFYTKKPILTEGTISSQDQSYELNGNIQLSIIYTTDQSANRTAIETAINNEYNIYP